MEKPLRVHAFAALAGVTVRALHHYDLIGIEVGVLPTISRGLYDCTVGKGGRFLKT